PPAQSAVAGAGPVIGPHPTFVGCKGSDCTTGSGIEAESVLSYAETWISSAETRISIAELAGQSIVITSGGVCSEAGNGFVSTSRPWSGR
ncbi:hypothetical protein LTR95_006676, partial [Oleoguttula sp. CCFEE 5521]